MDVAQNAPDTTILAEDEMTLYLQATARRVFAPKGQTPVIRADPGRDKTSFYGTLDLKTGREIVTQAATMNSDATAHHLQQILEAIPTGPILLFWDRAPWHGGQPVRELLAANPRLEIMRFPVAAPDENPQEHVWKDARHHVSHNHSVPRLPALADQVLKHLKDTTSTSSFLAHYGFHAICAMCK
jgi:transposase